MATLGASTTISVNYPHEVADILAAVAEEENIAAGAGRGPGGTWIVQLTVPEAAEEHTRPMVDLVADLAHRY